MNLTPTPLFLSHALQKETHHIENQCHLMDWSSTPEQLQLTPCCVFFPRRKHTLEVKLQILLSSPALAVRKIISVP